MKNKIIRFVLVGCGRISERHSEILGNNYFDGIKLVAVSSSPFRPKITSISKSLL